MLLYTEEQLEKSYRLYLKYTDVDPDLLFSLEEFRLLFEEDEELQDLVFIDMNKQDINDVKFWFLCTLDISSSDCKIPLYYQNHSKLLEQKQFNSIILKLITPKPQNPTHLKKDFETNQAIFAFLPL